MPFLALSCPQCAAPLPRQASWRMVTCPFCGATVTRSTEVVQAASFREAQARVLARLAPAERELRWQGRRFRVLGLLGAGPSAEVYLAERISPLPERVTIKAARAVGKPGVLQHEFDVLRQLQGLQTQGAAYFTQRLPSPVGIGMTEAAAGYAREALVLRHPTGYWGSLADVMRAWPHGIDPRHTVWIWRRVLEVLAFVHANGWTHGDLAPEHLVVHPRDHGVLMIGWSRARAADHTAIGRDLRQTAWTIRALLCGGSTEPAISPDLPAPLADLLRNCSEDTAYCARLGAAGLEQQLTTAARAAFGAPRFLEFHPDPHAGPFV